MGGYLNKRWIDYAIIVFNGMFWGYPEEFMALGVHVSRLVDVILSMIVFCMVISLIVCVIGFRYGARGRVRIGLCIITAVTLIFLIYSLFINPPGMIIPF